MKLFVFFIAALFASGGHASLPLRIEGPEYGSKKNWSWDRSVQRPLLIVFLSAKCPCSQSHESALKALAQEFPTVAFLGVHSNANEPMDMSGPHFARAALPFPVIRDRNSKLADELQAFKTPHAYLFNATGDLVFSGGVDDSRDANKAREHYLRDALAALVAGKTPPVIQARSLGCIIQR